jgi:hypothetical protein
MKHTATTAKGSQANNKPGGYMKDRAHAVNKTEKIKRASGHRHHGLIHFYHKGH